MTFKNKIAIITGGSEGIGFGIASALASQGAHVYLLARTQEKLQTARDKIQSQGGRADIYPVDITNQAEMRGIIDEVYGKNNRLDIFVNNAGEWTGQTIGAKLADGEWVEQTPEANQEDIRRTNSLIFEAPFEITTYLTAKFKPLTNNQLQILTIDSQAGLKYMPGNLGYGAGKMSLAVSLLHLQGELNELDLSHIKLYALYPGTVATPKLLPLIKAGSLQNPTTLESVVDTAINMLRGRTPSKHAYVGYRPGRGIVAEYLEFKPKKFSLLPLIGEPQVIDANFTPEDLLH